MSSADKMYTQARTLIRLLIQEEKVKKIDNNEYLSTLENISYWLAYMQEIRPSQLIVDNNNSTSIEGFTVHAPILEKLQGDEARLLIRMPLHVAESLRRKFSYPLVPAALDASEAIVRVTHALAGAAIEMTHVVKKLGDKL